MITLTLGLIALYLILFFVLKLGLSIIYNVLKVAFFPFKLVLGGLFGIIGFILLLVLGTVFIIPLCAVLFIVIIGAIAKAQVG